MTESTVPFLGNEDPQGYRLSASLTYQWDVSTLQWAKGTQPLIAGGVVVAGIVDGGDVAEGATTDAAITTDTTGTVSGKLRGLVKWAFERMPASLGQKTMTASLPMVLASDQLPLAVASYDNQISRYQRISPIGGAIVEQTTRLCGAQFEGSLANGAADNFWITARGTNATSVLAAKIVTLTSGATNSDWCSIRSEHVGRFLFANPNMFRSLVRFASVAAANTTTYIGAMSITNGVPQNGFGFAVDGAGVVSVKSWNATAAVINAARDARHHLQHSRRKHACVRDHLLRRKGVVPY